MQTGLSGTGIGWRPELALAIDRYSDLGFVEILAEDFDPTSMPAAIDALRQRGIPVIPHGVTLSLGGAAPPDPARLRHLADLATRLGAPLVSEHLAFVRGGGAETGHLLPLPRTRESLEVTVANILQAREALPVPLALENISTLFEWPDPEMDEADFLAEILERTDTLLLLDIANIHANARNFGLDPLAYLDRLPLDRLAYVHIAGGIEREGLYHDTHTYPVPVPALSLLAELCARTSAPGVMLERDDRFPNEADLHAELTSIAEAVARGSARGRQIAGPAPTATGRPSG